MPKSRIPFIRKKLKVQSWKTNQVLFFCLLWAVKSSRIYKRTMKPQAVIAKHVIFFVFRNSCDIFPALVVWFYPHIIFLMSCEEFKIKHCFYPFFNTTTLFTILWQTSSISGALFPRQEKIMRIHSGALQFFFHHCPCEQWRFLTELPGPKMATLQQHHSETQRRWSPALY